MVRGRARNLVCRLAWAALLLVIVALQPASVAGARTPAQSGPIIEGVQWAPEAVGQYRRLEITFQIRDTTATNLQFPYDPAPPAGVPAGTGISVDALFSRDGWQTTLVQPAFLYQPYERALYPEGDRQAQVLYPTGPAVWKVRFAPQETGRWQFRLRATDSRGTTHYPADGAISFEVRPSDSRGFVRTSQRDRRYFELSDGTPLVTAGQNQWVETPDLTFGMDPKFRTWYENRINLVRLWLSASSVWGAAWAPWSVSDQGYDGYLPPTALVAQPSPSGPFAIELVPGRRVWQERVPVQPGRTYRLSARVKTANVTGPAEGGRPYGISIDVFPCQDCRIDDPTSVTPVVNGTRDWTVVEGTFRTGENDHFLASLNLRLANATGGTAYVDRVSVREELGGGQLGPEMLRKGGANYHLYFDQDRSWSWDYLVEAAAQHGVYLKLVVMEKNDWILNRLDPQGQPTGSATNDNFYAAEGRAVRRLQEYYWRYLIARWGYSTAIHSWELLNEGDPYNGHHYELAEAFARFMHSQDPHRHLVTTSLWHSVPVAELWANPNYQSLDYADVHAGSQITVYDFWGEELDAPVTLDRSVDYHGQADGASARAPAGTPLGSSKRSIPVRGRGTWQVSCQLRTQGGDPNAPDRPRLGWWLDGGNYQSGYGEVATPGGCDDGWCERRGNFTLHDDLPHVLQIGFDNRSSAHGDAWFDCIRITAPDGRALMLNGDFDLRRQDSDAAWYSLTWSQRYGATSPSGAGKPFVRGEASLVNTQEELPDLSRDTRGVWFHNLTWAQINPGGMYELYWFQKNLWENRLHWQARGYRNFMDGVPLNNGRYADARAVASSPRLRVLGQADRQAGQAHLWIQNVDHTWRKVVDGVQPQAVGGSVRLPDMPAGTYQVEWWDTEAGRVLTAGTASGGPELTLTLPQGVATDIAVKVRRQGQPDAQPLPRRFILPWVLQGWR